MNGTLRFILVNLIILLAGSYLHLRPATAVPVVKPLADLPATHLKWEMTTDSRFDEGTLNVLKPTDYLYREYRGASAEKVRLYVGYHDGGKESGEIHSPRHCLPGNGWEEISTAPITLRLPEGEVRLAKAVYRKGEATELFLYWFQVNGRTISNEYLLKLSELQNSMIRGRRDSAFIRVSVPCHGDEEAALAIGMGFIRDFYPQLCQHLP